MNFMEQQKQIHSAEYQQNEQEKRIKLSGDYVIRGCLAAIQITVGQNYNNHHYSGYVSRGTDYDSIYAILIPPEQRTKTNKLMNDDLWIIENDSQVLSYIMNNLPSEIEKLGITDYSLRPEHVEVLRENNRDLFSWKKYVKNGEGYVMFIELNW